MQDPKPLLSPEEQRAWQLRIAAANQNNVFSHCRDCGNEWVASAEIPCPVCRKTNIEYILCWQFPDD